MLSQLKMEETLQINELSFQEHKSPQPWPFLFYFYPEPDLLHLIFYVWAAYVTIIVAMAEAPSWWTAVFLLAGTICYGSLVIRFWVDDKRSFRLSPSVGKWLLRFVFYVLLPTAALLFLALAVRFFAEGHQAVLPDTLSWLEHDRTVIKQLAGLICIIGFLGINAAKAAPLMTDRTWQGLFSAEMWLVGFLNILYISEMVLTLS